MDWGRKETEAEKETEAGSIRSYCNVGLLELKKKKKKTE